MSIATPRDSAWHDELMRQHWTRVRAWLRRNCFPAADAEDLAQETMLTAWRKRDVVPDDAIGWLLTTARFHLLNHSRTRRGEPVSRVSLDVAWVPDPPAVSDTAAEAAARLDVAALLATLADMHAIVLRLHYFHDLRPADIGVLLGASPAAIRKRLGRALEAARQFFTAAPTQVAVAAVGEQERLLRLHHSGWSIPEVSRMWSVEEAALQSMLCHAQQTTEPDARHAATAAPMVFSAGAR